MKYRFKAGEKVFVAGKEGLMTIVENVEFDTIFIGVVSPEFFGRADEKEHVEMYNINEVKKIVS